MEIIEKYANEILKLCWEEYIQFCAKNLYGPWIYGNKQPPYYIGDIRIDSYGNVVQVYLGSKWISIKEATQDVELKKIQ